MVLNRLSVCLFALLAFGCDRKVDPPRPVLTPEATLSALREALASHSSLDGLTDPLPWSQAVLLAGTVRVRELTGVSPMTEQSWQIALADTQATATPSRAFERAPRLLRDGHCVRIGDDPLPDEIVHLPMTDVSWPTNVRELRATLTPRLAEATSARFRCDDGPPFRAVFFRTRDGLRVAALDSTGR